MSIWIFLKIFSDCCVCFGILGAFPTVFPYGQSFLIPALVLASGVGISAFLWNRGKHWLSYAGMLLPVAFLTVMPREAYAGVLPVFGYCMIVVLRHQFALEYYNYRQYFKQSLMLMLGLYVLLSMLAFVEGMSGSGMSIIHPQATFRCALVHGVIGIILQRQLRLGSENGNSGRYQVFGLLGTVAVVLCVFLLAEPALRTGAAWILNTALSLVLSVVMVLFNLIGSMEDAKHMYEQVNDHRGNSDTPVMGNVIQEIIQSAQKQPEEPTNWWIWLVVALFAVVLILMLRTFRRKGNAQGWEAIVEDNVQPRRQTSDSRRTNRGKVRHYYREFLRMERKRGLILRKDMTTADILEKSASRTDPEGAPALREVYLQARYRRNKPISPEKVEKAKNALRKSREAVNS